MVSYCVTIDKNMRYYIILQPTIRSMGGEEMYTRNKVNSARERGYTPLVFHNGGGKKSMLMS